MQPLIAAMTLELASVRRVTVSIFFFCAACFWFAQALQGAAVALLGFLRLAAVVGARCLLLPVLNLAGKREMSPPSSPGIQWFGSGGTGRGYTDLSVLAYQMAAK